MNINPAAAASIAGVSRAASRGGDADNQAIESTRQQSAADKPAGRSSEAAIDAGDQTDDRGGDGRQVLDVFERDEKTPQQQEETETIASDGDRTDEPGEHIDLLA